MPSYKLYYFDARGRAEAIRLCFAYARVQFEDIRFTWDNWPEYQKLAPLGKCPFLEVDGPERRLGQTDAILRYVARTFDLYAGVSDEFGRAKVDELACLAGDLMFTCAPFYIKLIYEKQPAEADKALADLNTPRVQPQLQTWNALLGQTPFLFGDKPTYADFIIYHMFDSLQRWQSRIQQNIIAGHVNIEAFLKQVESLPQLKSYLANRPAPNVKFAEGDV